MPALAKEVHLDQAEQKFFMLLEAPVVHTGVHNPIEIQVPQDLWQQKIQTRIKKTKGITTISYQDPQKLSHTFPNHKFITCLDANYQTHTAAHSSWPGGMGPSGRPNDRNRELPWLSVHRCANLKGDQGVLLVFLLISSCVNKETNVC